MLANAAAANIWANLSDIWGRKPILLAAIAIFFVSSIICATATDMASLIVGRSFQGAAGGGLIQLVSITISDLFSVRYAPVWMGLRIFRLTGISDDGVCSWAFWSACGLSLRPSDRSWAVP
jgi:MFS family permease